MNRPVLLLLLFLCLELSSQAQIDSLKSAIETQSGKDKCLSWINLARAHVMQGEDSLAYVEGLKGLEYIQSQKDTAALAQIMYYLHFAAPEKEERLQWLIRSEKASVHLKKPFQYYIREALIYDYQDRAVFTEALRLSLLNVKFSKSLADTALILNAIYEHGYTLDRMKSYTEAISVYEEALPLALNYSDPILHARCNGLIGIAYDELRDFEKAKEYNRKAIELFRTVESDNAKRLLATWLSNLGNTLTKTKEYDLAESALSESLNLSIEYNKKTGKSISYINLGKLKMDMGQIRESKNFLFRGMSIAKEYDLVRFQSEGHNRLAEYYMRIGNVDSSLFHFEQYHVLNDSLINADKLQQISDLQVFYETAEKEQENELLRQKNEILALEGDRQRFWLIGSVGLLALVSLISLLWYRVYRAKAAARSQAKVIAERERGIKAMIQSVEEERQRIAKDLHDGIGQQMTAIKLKWSALQESLQGATLKQANDIGSILDATGKDIRTVSHEMMPRALMELGLVPALRDMIELSLEAAEIPYNFEVLGEEKRVSQDVEIGMFRVTQELINNIIKHSDAKHVEIQVFFRESSLILTIEDDGVGIKDTSQEGVGMLNIFNRVSALKGEARYEDASESGTVAVIRVPLT